MHGLPHFLLLWSSLHGCLVHSYIVFTYHCYTCMHGFSILVIWIPVPNTCIIVPCSRIHVIWLCPVTDMDFLLLDMRAVAMRYVESHIYCYIVPVILFMLYCSRYPLYCSTLSTELWSSYHVTRIMYCMCSCYSVYLTYQIIKLTWVWGRLDGWLDLIGWCTGSILLKDFPWSSYSFQKSQDIVAINYRIWSQIWSWLDFILILIRFDLI